ncbi:hypothetical protein BSKO_01838 [Bryopsis sp. KO-2023]|nr:hypothetical protein BSKO_01838 [Bryopsis sp. KO-2023]
MVGFAPEHLEKGQGHDVNSSGNSAAHEHHTYDGSSGHRDSTQHLHSNPPSWFRGIPHLHWYDTCLPDDYYDLCSPEELDPKTADYWKTRAGDAESRTSRDNYADAVEILEEGIRQGAEPREELESALEDVRIRWRSTERIKLREAEHFGLQSSRGRNQKAAPAKKLPVGTVSRTRCIRQWIKDHNPTTATRRTLDSRESDVHQRESLVTGIQSIASSLEKQPVTTEHSGIVTLDGGMGGDVSGICNQREGVEKKEEEVNQGSINTKRGPGRESETASFGFDVSAPVCAPSHREGELGSGGVVLPKHTVASSSKRSQDCGEGRAKNVQSTEGKGERQTTEDCVMEDKSSGGDRDNGDAGVVAEMDGLPMSDAEKGKFLDRTKDTLAIVLARLLEATLVQRETDRDCAQVGNSFDPTSTDGCHSAANLKPLAGARAEEAADEDNMFCSPMSVDEDDDKAGVIKNLFSAGRPARLTLSFDSLSLSKGASSTDSGIFDHMPTTTCWGENDRAFIGSGSPLDRANGLTKTQQHSADKLASPVLKPGPFPGCGPVFGALVAEDKVSSASTNPRNGKSPGLYGLNHSPFHSPFRPTRTKRMSAPSTMGLDMVCEQASHLNIGLESLREEKCDTAPPISRYGVMDSRERQFVHAEPGRRSAGGLPNQDWDIVGSLGLYPPSSQPYAVRSQDWYCRGRGEDFEMEGSVQNGVPSAMLSNKMYSQARHPPPCDSPYASRLGFLPGQPRPPMYRGCSNGAPPPSPNATAPNPSYRPVDIPTGTSDWVSHHRGVVRWFDSEAGGAPHRSREHGRGPGGNSSGDSWRREGNGNWTGPQGNGGGGGRRPGSGRGGGGRGGSGRYANFGRPRWEQQRPTSMRNMEAHTAAIERPSQHHHQDWQAWE